MRLMPERKPDFHRPDMSLTSLSAYGTVGGLLWLTRFWKGAGLCIGV